MWRCLLCVFFKVVVFAVLRSNYNYELCSRDDTDADDDDDYDDGNEVYDDDEDNDDDDDGDDNDL